MTDAPPRTVLMLQGPPCRFWRELGTGLEARGLRVIHVGLCLADVVLWRRPGLRLYRGRLADWPAWLARLIEDEGVSDVLYYADRQPYHAAALDVARAQGTRAWAIENGYLRPDWITLEPEAMGAYSRASRAPSAIRDAARRLPRPDLTQRFSHGFSREAVSEVVFHLLMTLGRPLFPRFVTGKHYPPALDYLGWLGKWAFGGQARAAVGAATAACARPGPIFLLALQLQSDYQIRASSPYRCLSEMISEVLGSFARQAPGDARLVVKLHPMDNGLERWPARVRAEARSLGLGDRVVAIDGGDLDALLARASGVVTVNSTLGLLALRRGCPVITLGDAVYDIEGLTHGGGLARFWTRPETADQALLADYLAVLAALRQVRGSFYAPEGRRAAIEEIARRLAAPAEWYRLERPLSALGAAARPEAETAAGGLTPGAEAIPAE